MTWQSGVAFFAEPSSFKTGVLTAQAKSTGRFMSKISPTEISLASTPRAAHKLSLSPPNSQDASRFFKVSRYVETAQAH